MKQQDRVYKYVIRSLSSRSFLVSLLLILTAIVLPEIVNVLNLNISKETVYAFSSAFATSGIVSVLYNYVTLDETREMIAETLLLNSNVQGEVLKEEKIEQLLDTSLTNVIGDQLKSAIKRSLIDSIRQYKNVTRHSYVLNVTLKNIRIPAEFKLSGFDKYLEEAFYQVEILSKFYEFIPTNVDKIKFIATSNDAQYEKILKEASKNNTLIYIYYLPGGIGSVLCKYKERLDKDTELLNIVRNFIFDIKDFRISGIKIENKDITREFHYDKNGATVEISINLPTRVINSKPAQIDYHIITILGKFENVFYQEFVRPYSSIDIWFDYEDTDILWAEPYTSFTSIRDPTIQRSADSRKVHVFIDEWVLPHSMIVFVLQRDECGLIENSNIGTKEKCKEFYKWALTEVQYGSPKYDLRWISGLKMEGIEHEKDHT